MIILKNNDLEVSLHPKGAEIHKIVGLHDNINYMWRRDPILWANSAPILFPFVGAVNDNEFRIDGKTECLSFTFQIFLQLFKSLLYQTSFLNYILFLYITCRDIRNGSVPFAKGYGADYCWVCIYYQHPNYSMRCCSNISLMLFTKQIVYSLHRIECSKRYFYKNCTPVTHCTIP